MTPVASGQTIIGQTFTELLRLESVVNVTLVACTIHGVDGVGLEIVGSHNVRLVACRVIGCGGANGRNPAVLIRPGGTRAKPVPNDIVMSSCQIEANHGPAVVAEKVANLSLVAGTKLHGRYDITKTPGQQNPWDDQPLLVVQDGIRTCVDGSCLFTGGPQLRQSSLVFLPLPDRDQAIFRPRWGDRTEGRRMVAWV